jgi:glycosyltransferase involved in cell wall biosynthesis
MMNIAKILPRRRSRLAVDNSNRIRLLKVVPTFMCGGTENQFMALARSLDPARFDLEFACLRRWGAFAEELDQRRIPLLECDVTTFRSVSAFGQQAKLARHIARRHIDVVHAYSFYGNVFAVPPARLAGAPLVIASIRDRAPYLTPMQKRAQRYACQFADCILVNATAVKDWLIGEQYDPSKIVVIPNGVDMTRFRKADGPADVMQQLGILPGAPVVCVVSRLNRLKGLEQFLEAVPHVQAEFPAARFLIVGDTNPSDRAYWSVLTGLAERLRISDRITFAGQRDDVPNLLRHVSVSVMPSLNEALSNVVLESMAAGAPIVATRVGGTPEAIEDGVTGLLVPPADSCALAGAICRLLADRSLAARLGAAAESSVSERFSMERMVAETERLYRTLLQSRSHAPAVAGREYACK